MNIPTNRAEAEALFQAIAGGSTPEPGDSPVFNSDSIWEFNPGGAYRVVSRKIPDGSYNHAAAIQGELDYVSSIGGGTVFLQDGAYELSQGLTIPANCGLIGESLEGVRLTVTGANVTALTVNAGCLIKDITIMGNDRLTSGARGVYIGPDISRCKFRNVRFEAIAGSAIEMNEAYDNHFYTVHIEDCGTATDPSIHIYSTSNTANMNFFFGVQIQNGVGAQILIDANSFNNIFVSGHLEWFNGHASSQTYPNVSCAGYRNKFFGFHVVEGTYGFTLTGPRNELHGCFSALQATYGLYISGATAKQNKIFGGYYEGWSIASVQDPGGTELHGVDSTNRNCLIDASVGTRIIGGKVEGVTGAAAITVQNASPQTQILGAHIVAYSGYKCIYVGGSDYPRIQGNYCKTAGAPASNIDTGSSTGGIVQGNTVDGTVKVITVGNTGVVRDNFGYITQTEGVTTQSQSGASTFFIITHGLSVTPEWVHVTAGSTDASGNFYIANITSTTFAVWYQVAPPGGANNLTWYWSAGIRHRR